MGFWGFSHPFPWINLFLNFFWASQASGFAVPGGKEDFLGEEKWEKIPNFCIFPLPWEQGIFSIFPKLGAEVLYWIPKFLEPLFPGFSRPFVSLCLKPGQIPNSLPFYTGFISYFFYLLLELKLWKKSGIVEFSRFLFSLGGNPGKRVWGCSSSAKEIRESAPTSGKDAPKSRKNDPKSWKVAPWPLENSMDRLFPPNFWDKLPHSRDFQVTLAFFLFSGSSFMDFGLVCPKKVSGTP